jgi:hypothetical protein
MVEFIGNVNSRFVEYVQADDVLNSIVAFVPHLPHAEVLKKYETTDVQLLILAHTSIAPGNLPGKFFEYLASGNFILAIGPVEGDAALILKESRTGSVNERDDFLGLKNVLVCQFENWKNKRHHYHADFAIYTRRNLTGKLAAILN